MPPLGGGGGEGAPGASPTGSNGSPSATTRSRCTSTSASRARIVPPCIEATHAAMARPSPVPPYFRVIVESPAKAKTINKYLGKDFTVLASYGHVRDLVPKEGAVDPDHGFAMRYDLIEKNEKHVDAIAKAAGQTRFLHYAGVGGPRLDGGPGAQLLETAKAAGIPTYERNFSLTDVYGARMSAQMKADVARGRTAAKCAA